MAGLSPEDTERRQGADVWTGESITVVFAKYPAHSVCRCQRHTECAGYVLATLIDSPVLTPPRKTRLTARLQARKSFAVESWETFFTVLILENHYEP